MRASTFTFNLDEESMSGTNAPILAAPQPNIGNRYLFHLTQLRTLSPDSSGRHCLRYTPCTSMHCLVGSQWGTDATVRGRRRNKAVTSCLNEPSVSIARTSLGQPSNPELSKPLGSDAGIILCSTSRCVCFDFTVQPISLLVKWPILVQICLTPN